jgi:hypothetical protein
VKLEVRASVGGELMEWTPVPDEERFGQREAIEFLFSVGALLVRIDYAGFGVDYREAML